MSLQSFIAQLRKKPYMVLICTIIILYFFAPLNLRSIFLLSTKQESAAKEVDTIAEASSPEIEIENLSFMSNTKDNKPYKILANKAIKIENDQYRMSNVFASMNFSGNIFNVDALCGFYDRQNNKLTISDDIVGSYRGYDFRAKKLNMSLDQKNIKSEGAVQMEGRGLKIKADNFESYGDTIAIFKGNVKTSFDPN